MLTCDPGHETMITPQKVNKKNYVNSMWKDELKKKYSIKKRPKKPESTWQTHKARNPSMRPW